MEDQVPFKVYTFWTENGKPEVRRFGVEKSVVTSFHYLNAKLQDVYPGLKTKIYSVSWKDEDGDDVVISSDEEVLTALQVLGGDVIRLFVNCKSEETKEDECDIVFTAVAGNPAEASPGEPAVHYGVVCDSCDGSVVGFRYKCSVCEDYDLCSRCEAAGHHPEHCMIRVPAPTLPRTVIKAAIKRSRHFLKSVATAIGEDCPYKKHRNERGAEKKHRGHGHGGHHGPHAERGPHGQHEEHHHRPRRSRVSWLDTFATYMNEFANLAGDIDLDVNKPKAPETKTGQNTETQEQTTGTQGQTPETQGQKPQESQEKAQTSAQSTQAPKQTEPSTSANAQTQCPFNRPPPLTIDVMDLVEMFIGKHGNPFVPPTSQAQPSAPENATAPTSTPNNDVEVGQGDKKSPETVDAPAKTASSTSSVSDHARDASPDKADDWTMINKEKDLMETASALPETPAPIGFNLPQEFQERVKIAEGSLYPPLNTSTAVLNPKEPEVLKPIQATAPPAPAAAPKPQNPAPAPTAPQPQPQQPRQRHPKPHIDAAIQQMLAMGFTNDGGWLTQLLESKDGNIAAVLDLLTPVRK